MLHLWRMCVSLRSNTSNSPYSYTDLISNILHIVHCIVLYHLLLKVVILIYSNTCCFVFCFLFDIKLWVYVDIRLGVEERIVIKECLLSSAPYGEMISSSCKYLALRSLRRGEARWWWWEPPLKSHLPLGDVDS